MRLTISSKGDFNNIRSWLSKTINKSPVPVLRQVADKGVTELSNNTPRATGETASSWTASIVSTKGHSEVAWINTAHPNAGANIAILIDRGHATKNGGYVPPKPYIKQSMRTVWNDVDSKVIKELLD